jgi:hypothetical protein
VTHYHDFCGVEFVFSGNLGQEAEAGGDIFERGRLPSAFIADATILKIEGGYTFRRQCGT